MTAVAVLARVEAPVEAEGQISGGVLRVFRQQLGLTQQELADKLLLDVDTYRSWEHGRRPLTRVSIFRFRALCRALVDLGVPPALIGVLDVALDVDLDIGRALSSDENVLPQSAGCNETWQALMQWALGGHAPVMFQGLRADNPRICPRDQRVLMARTGWEFGG